MPVLETEHLSLRKITLDDAAFIHTLVNDPDWLRYIGDRNVKTLDDARGYIERSYLAHYEKHGFGLWVIEERDAPKPIGLCGLIRRDTLPDVDIGYSLLPEARGRGYAYEAAAAVLRHAFDVVGLTRLVAICTPDNAGSRRVLEKIGMTLERTIVMPGETEELCLYGIDIAPRSERVSTGG